MTHWDLLLSSAAIIAACTFFVRFFGGSIADQKPFSDDRKWDVDLYGVNFFVHTILFWSIIGYAIAYHFHAPLNAWWSLYLAFSVLPLVLVWLYLVNYALGRNYYCLKTTIIPKLIPQGIFEALVTKVIRLDLFIQPALITIVVSYTLTSIYLSGHTIWIFISTIFVFTCAWYLAVRESFHMLQESMHATIQFTNGESLNDVVLLKMNPTNVRICEGETIKIINIDQVKWLEIKRESKSTKNS